jgi:transcriptional regulator GlxA family with amidase domain
MIAPWFAKLDRAAEALATNKKALVTSLVAHFALAEEGKLPGRRIGEHWRFSRPALVAWLAGS